MKTITYEEFSAVELRVGTIIKAKTFSEARKAAYKIWADFGHEFWIKQS